MKTDTYINGWQDFVELCIASWVFCAPFFLGFFDNIPASLSCMFIGGSVIFTAMFGLARETPIYEWTTLCLSVLLIASPWLFSYSAVSMAVFNSVVCGSLLILFSVLAMMHEYHEMDYAKQKATPT